MNRRKEKSDREKAQKLANRERATAFWKREKNE